VFVTVCHFYPSLIFEDKVRSLPLNLGTDSHSIWELALPSNIRLGLMYFSTLRLRCIWSCVLLLRFWNGRKGAILPKSRLFPVYFHFFLNSAESWLIFILLINFLFHKKMFLFYDFFPHFDKEAEVNVCKSKILLIFHS
jgi:hypothetical protein